MFRWITRFWFQISFVMWTHRREECFVAKWREMPQMWHYSIDDLVLIISMSFSPCAHDARPYAIKPMVCQRFFILKWNEREAWITVVEFYFSALSFRCGRSFFLLILPASPFSSVLTNTLTRIHGNPLNPTERPSGREPVAAATTVKGARIKTKCLFLPPSTGTVYLINNAN